MTNRLPDETLDQFKARRLHRFAAAFRAQASKLDADGNPQVAEAMRDQARTAERAAGFVKLRSMSSGTVH